MVCKLIMSRCLFSGRSNSHTPTRGINLKCSSPRTWTYAGFNGCDENPIANESRATRAHYNLLFFRNGRAAEKMFDSERQLVSLLLLYLVTMSNLGADYFTGDDDFNAPILLAASGRIIACYGV
jgi:hypothetical protein